MKKIEKITFTTWEKLRMFCVKNNAYTCGDNEDYMKMLNKCDDFNAADNESEQMKVLYEISEDIYNHSDEEFKLNYTVLDTMETIWNMYTHTMFKTMD